MIFKFTVVCALFVPSAFVIAVSAFLSGKFNQLVTLRRQISTAMLQMDLALRKQSAELRTMGGTISRAGGEHGLSTEYYARLDRAEENAHRAVSMKLCDDGLAALAAADGLIASCWNDMAATGEDHLKAVARISVDANAEFQNKIDGFVLHYRQHLRTFPCRWIARISRFERLSSWNGLSVKRNQEMLTSSRSAL